MESVRTWRARAYWTATILALVGSVIAAAAAPIDPEMGPIQKLYYLHLPIAIYTFVCALVVFIASVAFIGGRRQLWDDMAYSAARVTVLNGTVLMITGVVWARVAWGEWWVWSPRLAFSLLLWLLYVAYLVMRPMFGASRRGAVIAAVYGVVAFLDVPLLYLSANMLPDVHPTHMALTTEMRWTLLLWFIATAMLTAGLIGARFALARRTSRLHEPEPSIPAGIGPRRTAA